MEPPLKKRKLELECSDTNNIIKYNDDGSTVEREYPSYEERLSRLIKKQSKHFFRESITDIFDNRLPVYTQQEEALETKTENLLAKPMRALENALVEGEKLRTLTKEFSKNYQFNSFKSRGQCDVEELVDVKMKAIREVQEILKKSFFDVNERISNSRKQLKILVGLQKNWNLKRRNESNRDGFGRMVKGGDLFIELSFDKSKVEPVMLFRDENKFEMVLSQGITYGKVPILVSKLQENRSINDVLKLAQESVYHQELFRYFVKAVLTGSKEFKVLRHSNYEIVIQIGPMVYMALRLEKRKVPDLPFWEVKCFHNIIKSENFSELVTLLLKEALLKVYKVKEEKKVNIFQQEIDVKEYSKYFLEVLRFLQHFWFCRKFISDCKQKKFDVDVENFIFPDKTYLELGEKKKSVCIDKLTVHLGNQQMHNPSIDNVKYVFKNQKEDND